MLRLSMESSLLLKRGLRRGLVNLMRDKGLTSSLLALTAVAGLLQLLFLLFIGAEGIQQMLRTQTDLRLEVLAGASNQQAQEFYGAVKELPYVEDVAYVTREQAYEMERKRDPELVSFLEEYGLNNPFPDTIAVTLASLDNYDAFSAFIRHEQWNAIVDPGFLSQVTDQEEQVYEMLRFTKAGRSLVLFFLVLVAGVTFFLLIELIRRRAFVRSEEIFIERLVGASPWVSVLPFAVEASLLMAGALLLSLSVLLLFLWMLPNVIPALAAGGSFAMLRREVMSLLGVFGPGLLLLQIILIPLLAVVGAWTALRKDLHPSRLPVVLG